MKRMSPITRSQTIGRYSSFFKLEAVGARLGMNEHVNLGQSQRWGQEQPALLSCADRRHHTYIVGKSGTGKTTLLRNMILQDIEAGRGVALIDPHGDLALDVLDHIPKCRVEEVVYFDPADPEYAISFNLLAHVPQKQRHLVASGIVAAFKGIFPDFFGPRMEYVFYAAVAALLDCEHVSLLALERLLTHREYRAWVVRQVKDPVVRRFWETEFESHDKRTKAEMVSPILNKVGPMFMSPLIRNVIGQVRNRIDARAIMDGGRIFIANLSKGRLGPDKANLLGSFLVSQFQVAAMARADQSEKDRRDFFLFADEFHSFVTDSFASLLSESRKYRMNLVLCHQYIKQLRPSIADAVFGNCGSLIAFRVGFDDAEALERAFGKAYSATAFTALSNGEAYMKLLERGKDVEPCFVETHPPTGERYGRRKRIIRNTRRRYGRKHSVVEKNIEAWFAMWKGRA
jgi:type IV secretory pathway TraG/TraD family ATPase VirD4